MSNETHRFFNDGRFVSIRWIAPNPDVAVELAYEVERIHDEVGDLFFAPIVGVDCPPPDPATREALLQGHDVVFECIDTMRFVILGNSISRRLMRSVMTAMTLATGLRGQGFIIEKSIPAMAGVAASVLDINADDLVDKLIAAGMVSPKEAGRR